ncbi:MAG: TlpA family protein disulfide reductase [Bdellovibrionales bacterium]
MPCSLKTTIVFGLFFCSCFAYASVFSDGVRFFEDDKVEKQVTEERPKEEKKPFDWNSFMNVENDEFFKEGDYTPPAPFLEALRRPTKENILLFEKWNETRNLLLQRYETARAQYVAKSNVMLPEVKRSQGGNAKTLEKFRFVFYFDAECPSCHAMFETVNQMVQKGVYVEAVRLDKGKQEVRGLSIPWVSPSPKEVQKINLKAVPFLMAFDDETKKVYQVTGRKTIEEIADLLERSSSGQ